MKAPFGHIQKMAQRKSREDREQALARLAPGSSDAPRADVDSRPTQRRSQQERHSCPMVNRMAQHIAVARRLRAGRPHEEVLRWLIDDLGLSQATAYRRVSEAQDVTDGLMDMLKRLEEQRQT